VFIGLIFFHEGLRLDLALARRPGRFLRPVSWGAVVALGVFPAAAFGAGRLFGLAGDDLTGLIIIAAMPCSLTSAMVIAEKAGADDLTAVVLLAALNLLGLASIPLNLSLWLGRGVEVRPLAIVVKLVLYLFLPLVLGQVLRRIGPGLVRRLEPAAGFLPPLCLGLIVYAAFADETQRLLALKWHTVFHLLWPCLALHLTLLGLAFVGGRWLFGLKDRVNRAVTVVASEKPITVAVAVWSMSFQAAHPLAVFPMVMLYVAQIVTDSVWAGFARDSASRGRNLD
jgi:predicted Na+-dependent transporter